MTCTFDDLLQLQETVVLEQEEPAMGWTQEQTAVTVEQDSAQKKPQKPQKHQQQKKQQEQSKKVSRNMHSRPSSLHCIVRA